MIDIDSFSQAVAQIYDASLSAERWDEVLATFRDLFDSPMAQLNYFRFMQDPHALLRYSGFDPETLNQLQARYSELTVVDPRWPPRMFKVYHCRQLVSDEALHRSDMYRHVLAPARIEYTLLVYMDLEGEGQCVVGVMRRPGSPPFTEEDCEDLGRFVPHISRAVTMHGTLRRAYDMAAAAQSLIDSMPMGMIVLQDERIVLANAAAAALLNRGGAVRRLGDRLQATTPQGEARLSTALRGARDGRNEPIGVTLPAGDGGQVRAVVRRLEASSAGMLRARPDAVAVYLTDPAQPIEAGEEVVRRLFGLTEREAGVLCALVRGDDTRAIARRLGIGVETVKTHLQHIMQAVGVSRQAELVRLVLSSPAWIADPRPQRPTRVSRARLPRPPGPN